MRLNGPGMMAAMLCVFLWLSTASSAAEGKEADVETIVTRVIRPLMTRYGIPGMAIGIIANGRGAAYDYGVMSRTTQSPVGKETLFEIGSVSKTFTATIASYAQVGGFLSLSDSASTYIPSLRGSNLDTVSLLNLATHTTGGMPLQVPETVTNDDQLMTYFRNWKPAYAPGTYRTYANPSIGLLGMIVAQRLKAPFAVLMEDKLFSKLGMAHAYLDVPETGMRNYAQGYTQKDAPARMAPGVLAFEAYGIKTTIGGMVRFIEANMGMIDLDRDLQRAITGTHTGYYRIGPMTQDLIWEQYPYPVTLKDLLAGNSAKVSYEANPAAKLDPPLPPREDVLINKTGSTNGFASYVVFVPKKKIGIVLLANKNYPIDARVTAAYDILTRLDKTAPVD